MSPDPHASHNMSVLTEGLVFGGPMSATSLFLGGRSLFLSSFIHSHHRSMLQADKEKVVADSRVSLLSVQQAELDFHVSRCLTLGLQSTLVAALY